VEIAAAMSLGRRILRKQPHQIGHLALKRLEGGKQAGELRIARRVIAFNRIFEL